jgi:hypothetical protein
MPAKNGVQKCRHCSGFSLDSHQNTYASVLVAGTVFRRTVESLEERIVPCVTAVCPACDRVSLISDGSTESMLCSIFMWQRLREWIDTGYDTSGAAAMAAGILAVKDDDGGGVTLADAIDAIKGEDESKSEL